MEAVVLSVSRALLTEAGKTVLIGLLVVFAVLILLTLIFRLFGVFSALKTGRQHSPKKEPEKSDELIAAIAGVVAMQNDEVSDEVAAVIAAAVAAMSDGKTRYVIRRITPAAKAARSTWAAAGIAQNTQPF